MTQKKEVFENSPNFIEKSLRQNSYFVCKTKKMPYMVLQTIQYNMLPYQYREFCGVDKAV